MVKEGSGIFFESLNKYKVKCEQEVSTNRGHRLLATHKLLLFSSRRQTVFVSRLFFVSFIQYKLSLGYTVFTQTCI